MEKKIAIIAAMEDVELEYLKNSLGNKKRYEYKGIIFYEGEMFHRTVILCVSGVGLINATMATTITIEKFNPSLIINEGIVGGYTNDLHIGSIIACIDAINITSLEYVGSGDTFEDYEITTFLHNEENRLIKQRADEKLIKIIRDNFENITFRYDWKR